MVEVGQWMYPTLYPTFKTMYPMYPTLGYISMIFRFCSWFLKNRISIGNDRSDDDGYDDDEYDKNSKYGSDNIQCDYDDDDDVGVDSNDNDEDDDYDGGDFHG